MKKIKVKVKEKESPRNISFEEISQVLNKMDEDGNLKIIVNETTTDRKASICIKDINSGMAINLNGTYYRYGWFCDTSRSAYYDNGRSW